MLNILEVKSSRFVDRLGVRIEGQGLGVGSWEIWAPFLTGEGLKKEHVWWHAGDQTVGCIEFGISMRHTEQTASIGSLGLESGEGMWLETKHGNLSPRGNANPDVIRSILFSLSSFSFTVEG